MVERLALKPGLQVIAGSRQYCIRQILDLETVLAQDVETRELQWLKVFSLQPLEPSPEIVPANGNPDLITCSETEWETAQARFAHLRPLLEAGRWNTAIVQTQAKAVGVHPATLYRWLQQYRRTGRISSLVPTCQSGGRGQNRLNAEVEAVIQATIEEIYLNEQKPSMQHTCNEVHRRCRNAGFEPPHANTVRNRIAQRSDQEKLKRREGSKAFCDRYTPLQGCFPGADWPLAVVQIDHTPIDIILVDDLHRRPVGRPWMTLAIDVFSRMVAGLYISFAPPGAMAVGLCLAQAILPKEMWLVKRDIRTSWPVWGIMNAVHADNAREFRGHMLTKACQEYGIDLHWRPVARPHFGGHIERLLGTFNKEIHTLPGSTFSNPAKRGHYDADKKAALTLGEFERWLAIYIVEIYHQRLHGELGASPLKRYEEGIFGTPERPGRGLPERFIDETRLRLDFMPYVERSVQPYGLVIDEIHYYDNVLRPWINARDPQDPRHKRKFVVRRDPRDISVVYFYDPELREYFAIPYRDTSRPPLSLWELKEAQRRLRDEGRKGIDEDLIFATYNRLRALEEAALQETKAIRRAAQRRRENTLTKRLECSQTDTSGLASEAMDDLEDIHPFDELEELDD
jgi:putative transposase